MPICKIHGKAGKGKGRSLKVRKSLKCWSVTEIRWNSKTCLCVIAGAIRTSAKTIHELASWMPHVSAGILLNFFSSVAASLRRLRSLHVVLQNAGGTCHVHRCSHTEQATLLVLPIVACNQQDTLSTLYEMRRSELQLGFFFCYNWAFYPRDEWETEWILPPTLRITDRAPQLTYTSDI